MPQDFKKYENPKNDGRRKIMPEQYEEVIRTYRKLSSYQKTADVYRVSKRLIIFIVNPEKYEEFLRKRYDKKVWFEYYDREAHTKAQKKFRKKKRKLGLAYNVPR
jgi:hypothetical protein